MDPLTITACISGATRAYNMVAKAVNAGREIEDTAQYIGKFFDSKEKILEIEKENQYGPKFLRGSSVEAAAAAESAVATMRSVACQSVCGAVIGAVTGTTKSTMVVRLALFERSHLWR